jgi:hypothetical protein
MIRVNIIPSALATNDALLSNINNVSLSSAIILNW